jgi:hypothetical protein
MNIFPVAIDDVFDTVEDPPPLPDDSPPGKDSQLQRNHVPVDSSSNVGTPASRIHYNQNNRNTSTSLLSECSKSYPKDVVSSDSRESGLSSDCGNKQASSSDISALTGIPQLSSRTWKKRRHRGRPRQHSDNVMVTGSPQDGPSPRTAASGSSTSVSTVPSAASFRDTDPAGFAKSASCGSWSFMRMVSDPVSCGLESSSTETAPLASPDTADSPTTTTCSSTPPRDQHSLTKRSWYTQALPFFSVSLGGDDDVTEVQYTLFHDVLYERGSNLSTAAPAVLMTFSSFSSVFQANTWLAPWNWVASRSTAPSVWAYFVIIFRCAPRIFFLRGGGEADCEAIRYLYFILKIML